MSASWFPRHVWLLLVVLAVASSALPSSIFHETAQPHADKTAAKQAQKPTAEPHHQSEISSTATPVKPSIHPPVMLDKPKKSSAAALNKAYKLHASGLTKRNENSVLKREQLYSEPPGGEYRFFRRDEFDRRRRSPRMGNSVGLGYTGRMKRDLPSHLDADDALALLALWASAASAPPRRMHLSDSDFRENTGYGGGNFEGFEFPNEEEMVEDELQRQDEDNFPNDVTGWGGAEDYGDRLNVMRRAGPALYPLLPSYQRRSPAPELGWGNFAPPPHKRFMVSKRSRAQQPQSDVYSLAQLLSERPEPSAPLYRRLMF